MTRALSALLPLLLTLACDPEQLCPATTTTTSTSTSGGVTEGGDTSSSTGAEDPPTVGDFCDEKADCVASIETDAGASPLKCLLPWGYCSIECQTDGDCSPFDYEFGNPGSGVWVNFVCADFAGSKYCYQD